MIEAIIRWSIVNRLAIILLSLILSGMGVYALKHTAIDAIPDLSDVQVIIKTSYPGQAPQIVEDQITYPLSTTMLSVPGAQTVRGFSFFGDSYVYVIFDDETDLYWARSRVLEYLNQISAQLPESATPRIGPDATGVGWVYLYALADRTGQRDLAELRSFQDWFLKPELQAVDGVSEVATVGGMVRQYQIVADPNKLRAYGIPLSLLSVAVKQANGEAGASVIEMAEAEYMVRVSGYLSSIEDIENTPLGMNSHNTPLLLKDVATVSLGPQMRRGVAELNGEGEVVGGIVVMRYGENAQQVINRVERKLEDLRKGLPEGVEVITTYDRSGLIERAVKHLFEKLIEEMVVVFIICAVFLFHFRSSLVVLISLPVGVLVAYWIMFQQGLNANIMSLGGIAIAIGAMVDGAIVMIENLHKHMEKRHAVSGVPISSADRWQLVSDAAIEVGRPLFFSLLIITVSFLPVFTLEAQEGKLFAPLAFTKTYAMAAAAGLAITLVPVLMGYFIRGNITPEQRNPINRGLRALYSPLLGQVLAYPKVTLFVASILMVVGMWPLSKLGAEYMPPLDEGDLMYMPTTYPGLSIGKARELLQQTDKLIKTVPEVERVFGKIGRAETATDPAPLTMIETFITLKPKHEWRPGLSSEALRQELDALVRFPGISNAWVMPIKTRIDMLSTGVKTPIGIKIAGPELEVIQRLGLQVEAILQNIEGTSSVYSERVEGGRYIKVDIDRLKAARFGMSLSEIQSHISSAVGGVVVTETVEGLERYPVNLRYPQWYRDSEQSLKQLPLVNPRGQHIVLEDLARIYVDEGPAMIKTENARLNGWVLVDFEGRDLASYLDEAKKTLGEQLELPAGYSLAWSGQYEYLMRAKDRLNMVLPLTLAVIIVLLYFSFGRAGEVIVILLTVPFALIGGVWLLYLFNFNLSVAVSVGFIATLGLAVEIGVLMLVYLNQSFEELLSRNMKPTKKELEHAVAVGAAKRVRPIVMTVLSVAVGLLPLLLSEGSGSEVMQRIATPMVGGTLSTMVLTLLILPAVFLLWKTKQLEVC